MGVPKALLDWGGRPLIVHQVSVLAAHDAVAEIVVVTGHAADQVTSVLAGSSARAVRNPNYRSGRATSIAAGARALDERAAGILIVSVDQPLESAVVQALLQAWRADPGSIWRPTYQNQHGHPVTFPHDLRGELEAVTDATQGLRAVMRGHADRVRDLPVDQPSVLLNLNSPEVYAAARRQHAPAPSRST
jgi:CTP:molybdopterin cytidylyltransferase MocA